MSKLHGPLGESVGYTSRYDPSQLYAINREEGRRVLGITSLPFHGVDYWNAYEVSWLNQSGKPVVACVTLCIPADSPNIVESKSLKLYLNSFNQTSVDSPERFRAMVKQDVGSLVGADIEVLVYSAAQWSEAFSPVLPVGVCLDELDISPRHYQPAPSLLAHSNNEQLTEVVYSHLLRSCCPVTSQPDWATVEISYSGQQICHRSLLAYIVSYRQHNDFHEHCVENIFTDIQRHCQPSSLTVSARYTRRGGIDINPWRSTDKQLKAQNLRSVRQ